MTPAAASSMALALLLLAACGGDPSRTSTAPPTPNPVSPSAVVIGVVPSDSRENEGETPKQRQPRSQAALQP